MGFIFSVDLVFNPKPLNVMKLRVIWITLILITSCFASRGQCIPATIITNTTTVCGGSTVTYFTPPLPQRLSYNWQVIGGTIVSANGLPSVQILWTTAGAQYVRLAYSDNICSNLTTQKDVIVNGISTPSLNGNPEACQTKIGGGAFASYSTDPGKSSYQWFVSSGGVVTGPSSGNTIKVIWTVAGPQSVSVSYSDPCRSNSSTINVLINPMPNPLISGPSIVCGETGGHVYSTESGMTSYNWGIYNGTIVSGRETNTVTVKWSSGEGYIEAYSYSDKGCGIIGANQKSVSAKYVTDLTFLNGFQKICEGTDPSPLTEASAPTGNGSFYYQWMKSPTPMDPYVNIENATNSSYDPPLGEEGSFKRLTFTKVDGNLCPTSSLSSQIYIWVNHINPSAINSSQSICVGSDPAPISGANDSATGTITTQWQKSSDNINFSDISGATSLTYDPPVLNNTNYYRRKAISTYSGTVCEKVGNVISITTALLPQITTQNKIICSGQSTNLVLLSDQIGATYIWTVLSKSASITGTTVGTSGQSDTIAHILTNSSTSIPGTIVYRIMPIANGCSGQPTDVTVTVNPKPTITNNTPQLQTTICTGSSLNFTPTTNFTGTTFTWTSNVSGSITGAASSGSGSITNTLTNSGSSSGTVTYTITPTNSGCSGTAANYIVTVNPKINAMLIGAPLFCTSTKLSAFPAGNSYLWSNGMTTQSITVSSSGTYSVTVSNAILCSETASINVTKESASAYIYPTGDDLCSGITLTSSYGTSYRWSTGSSASSIRVYSPGTYRVTVTKSNGCTATASYTASSDPLISRAIGGAIQPARIPPCPLAQASSSEQLLEEIYIYPNPANEEVVVQLTTSVESDVQLNLFNQLGMKVETFFFKEGENKKTIPTKDLSDGFYFIRIGNTVTKKIIVKHH